jgi:hypothetical protein
MKRTRAFRRKQHALKKKYIKRFFDYYYYWTIPYDDRDIGKSYNTRKQCNCSSCKNPRRNKWNRIKETIQERRHDGIDE